MALATKAQVTATRNWLDNRVLTEIDRILALSTDKREGVPRDQLVSDLALANELTAFLARMP